MGLFAGRYKCQHIGRSWHIIDSGLARYPFCSDNIDFSCTTCRYMKHEEMKFGVDMMLPTPVERLSFVAHEHGPIFWHCAPIFRIRQAQLTEHECLFLSALLDALATGVERALAACFSCQFFACFGVCCTISILSRGLQPVMSDIPAACFCL